MTQERLALVVRQATDSVVVLADSGITVIREGAWFQEGDAKARVVVGRSGAGYHVGLCADDPPNGCATAWGEALPSVSHALSAGEAALDAWLEIKRLEE
jgi:hypothetical protein